MSQSGRLSAEEVLAYLASERESVAEPPPEQVQAYREAAAVLVAVEDPESLQPLGGEPAAGGVTALLGADLVPATGRKFGGRVMLTPNVRAETIQELVSTGRLEDALAANPDERNSPLQAHFERYLRHEAPPLDQQSLEELDATRQVSLWLSDVVAGVPTLEEVDARAAYLKLIELFETLAGDAVFRGRRGELDQLRNYIGVVSPETVLGRVRGLFRWTEPERQPAVSISGIGGVGKSSLIARFMLEHTRLPEDSRVPFGYLDFARSSLDIADPLGLCLELLRQLDFQFPGHGGFDDIRDRAVQLDLRFRGDDRSADSGDRAVRQWSSDTELAPEAKSGDVTELRVNGVGGSPPGAVLGDLAPEQVSGDAIAGFYRTSDHDADAGHRDAELDVDRHVEVFSWGGRTSRSKVRVLWLALLPFLLANVAGWMCPDGTRRSAWRFRLHRLAGGLGALALTVNAALIAVMISADVVAYQTSRAGLARHQWWLAPLGWHFVAGHPARQVMLGVLVPVLLGLALVWLASRSWRYEAVRPPYRMTDRRKGKARKVTADTLAGGLADTEFWDGEGSVRLLTWLHVAVAAGFLAIVLGVTVKALNTAGSPYASALGWIGIGLGAAAVALAVSYVVLDALSTPSMTASGTVGTAAAELADRFRGWVVYLLVLAVAGLIFSGVFAWLQPAGPARRAADLPGMSAVTGWTALAIAVAVAVALVSMLLGLPGSKGTLVGGPWVTLMLGFALLNIVMLGAEIWVAHLVGPVTSDAAELLSGTPGHIYLPYVITSGGPLLVWAAVLAVLVFGAAEGVRWWRTRRLPDETAREYRYQAAAFRDPQTGPLTEWYWSGLAPFPPPGDQTGDAGASQGWERNIARAQFLGRASRDAAWLLWGIIGAQLVMGLCVWQLHVQPPGVVRNIGVALAVLVLPALMAFLAAAWSDPAKPRAVGVLWGVGTFWPRSYHPLSPPCYTERAIPDLQRRMWWLHDNGGRVVLVGHGQGAVLATAALVQPGCRSAGDRPALITFGAPICKLYSWAFPAYFDSNLVQPLAPGGPGRLADWRNFYYPTDPIGGPVAPDLSAAGFDPVDTEFLDPAECYYVYGQPPPSSQGHSGYWTDPRVWSVINRVAAALPGGPPDDISPVLVRELAAGLELPPEDRLAAARALLGDVLERMRREFGPRPYVVVLDTFEEVQYRGEQQAFPVWEMLAELQNRAPFLRVVVVGRAPVESLRLAGRQPGQIVLGELDRESAMAFLSAQGITDETLQGKLVQTFGRLPLSLKLVGALAERTRGGAAALLGPADSGLSLLASGEVIQGQLYGRLLDQIADERVRRLAHPGLTLRRINPELILEVLNEPCGLGIRTLDEAEDLFEELRRESSLVSVDSSDGELVYRPDLRRVMLKMVLAGAPAQVEQIRRAAVAWYAHQDSRRGRAEELYHQLLLGDQVDDRELSDREVRPSIQAVIEEFPPEVQLRLATLGFSVPPEVSEQATREQRHASLASQIEELLPYGPSSVDQAQAVFASAQGDLRGGNLPFSIGARPEGSPLFRSGARIAAQRGDEKQALDLIERGLDCAVREGAATLTLGLLQERAWLYRHRVRTVQAEGLAWLGEQARRHQNRSAQLQYLAQSINTGDDAAQSNLAALGDLLSYADPEDAWGLVPALQPAVELAQRIREEVPLARLQSLILAQTSPFRSAVFPDPMRQSALDALLFTGSDAGTFADAFLRLSEAWPYRILFVVAPYGRRGEQLSTA